MVNEINFIDSLFEGTILEPGYGYIPRMVMRDKTLSRDSKAIYAYIMSFAGNKMTAFPSWKTICTELGFKSKDTFYKYMNELKERGFISVTQQKEKGKFDKNIYKITLKTEEIKDFIPFPKKSESEKLGTVKNGNRKNQEPNINNSSNTNNTNENLEVDVVAENFKELKNMFQENICELRPTTIKQFYNYVCKYDYRFIKSLIIYCTEIGTISFAGFKAAIEDFISKDATTPERMIQEIYKFRESKMKPKKQYNKKKQTDNFNNFDQREYDFDSLEKKLLGWEK